MSPRRRSATTFGLVVLLGTSTHSFAYAAQNRGPQPPRPRPPSEKLLAGFTTPHLPPEAHPSPPSEQELRESAKLGNYLIWLDRVERERAVLRDTGMTASNPFQAFERIRSFEDSVLTDRPLRPESLISGDRFYLAAVTREAKHTVEIIRALREGDSRRAQILAREGSQDIDRQLEKMRRELSWYFRQRKLGSPPEIAPSATGSYFGYLAGHAPR